VKMQAQDVAVALAHIQAYGAKAGWDMSRMVVIGHSAGAHLAVLVSVDGQYMRDAGVKPWLATISLDSGALNVPQIMTGRHMGLYDDAFGENAEGWQAVSPLHRITQAPMSMLLVCSSRRKYSCDQASEFTQAITAAGGTSYALPEDMSHGDINDELGKNAAYTAQIDDFLRHVGWFGANK
jgi:arylformamidase